MVRLRVAKLLKERGMNAHQLAHRAGIPITTAYRLVRPTPPTTINVRTIDRVCWALGVTPGDLFDYARERPKR